MNLVRPSFITTVLTGVRFEGRQLFSSWLPWTLITLFPAAALALGALETSEPAMSSYFDNARLAMFMTIVPIVLGFQASTAALKTTRRELTLARVADEGALLISRVTVIGSFGFLTVLMTYLALTASIAVHAPWMSLLGWLPIMWLLSVFSAVLGSLAAAIFMQLSVPGLPLAILFWILWHPLSLTLGPSFPDLLLRVLRWDPLFKEAPAEAVRPVLLIGTISLIVLGSVIFMALVSLASRQNSGHVFNRARHLTWILTAALLGGMYIAADFQRVSREQVLLGSLPMEQQVDLIEWIPHEQRVVMRGPLSTEVLRGPVRPTTVSPGRYVFFTPYIGRHGVALPLSVLEGHEFEIELVLPDGWVAHGCTTPDNRSHCATGNLESTWLIIVPRDAIEAEANKYSKLSPRAFDARTIFKSTASRLLSGFELTNIKYVPVAGTMSFWLGENTVAMATALGDAEVSARNAHNSAAAIVASGLSRRSVASSGERDNDAQEAPTWLSATLDRIAFEFDIIPVDPTEAPRRSMQSSQMPPLYPRLPMLASEEFNTWWLQTDEYFGNHETTARHLLELIASLEHWSHPALLWNHLLVEP